MYQKVEKIKTPSLDKDEIKNIWREFTGVEVKESWLDKRLIEVANGKTSGLLDKFRKDSKIPLEDLGVKVVMFSGVPT